MPIQPENKVFPHTVPPLPERSGNLKEDVETLYTWIFDQQGSLNELNRQVVDKYNMHVDGTHAHPKAWEKWRLKRPAFIANTADASQVLVEATSDIPALFAIDGELFEITSDLTMDLDTSGAGGLDTGAKAADTPYYLYGIRDSSTVALICSVTAPSTGPTGYTGAFTYLGAFLTDGSSAVRAFSSNNGLYVSDEQFHTTTNVTSTSATARTVTPFPATAIYHYGRLDVFSGTTAGRVADASGVNSSTGTALEVQNGDSNSAENSVIGFIPALSAAVVYLRVNNADATTHYNALGWVEDPTEYA